LSSTIGRAGAFGAGFGGLAGLATAFTLGAGVAALDLAGAGLDDDAGAFGAGDFFTTDFSLARLLAARAGEGFGFAAFFAGAAALDTGLTGLTAFFDFAAGFFAGITVSGADRPRIYGRAIIQTTGGAYSPEKRLRASKKSAPARMDRKAAGHGKIAGQQPDSFPYTTAP